MCKNRFLLLIAFFMIRMLVVTTPEAEAQRGFYLGLGPVYNTIEGDLDGQSGLQGGTEVIILPDINPAVGIDIVGGYRTDDWWTLELNFMTSGHDGTWAGIDGDVSYFSLSLNAKYSFAPSSTTRPYLLVGFGTHHLEINDGAADLFSGEVSDATLSGPGFNLGIGIDQYFSPRVSLNIGMMYRYIDYTQAEGVHGSGEIDDGVNGSGFSLKLSTVYHF